ncbi:WD40 repeat-like protein [Paxillus ammoniavirescens]|nr:WD40 repeat-like protein [Paxillus ammoniavirescens]
MSSRLYDTARNAYWRIRRLPLPPLVLPGHTDWIWSVGFLPDGKQVISGSEDRNIRAWMIEDGGEVGTVMKQGTPVLAVAVSSNGQWIATGGMAKTITIWDATTHEKAVELDAHSGWVKSLAFSPDSARVVSGSGDGTVIVWSTTTGERLVGPPSLKGHTDRVDSVAFSPDGNEFASCVEGDIRIWHGHTGELIIPPIQVKARSLAWSPNGRRLIVGCRGGAIKLFDTSSGSLFAEWKGHTRVVYSIATSPNGKFFASGSGDSTIRLWDATTLQQIGPALQHDQVYSIAISPDGHHLVSGGLDRNVRIWSLRHIVAGSLLENNRTNAPANIHDEEVNSQQVPKHLAGQAQDTQTPKGDDKDEQVAEGGKSKGVEHSLHRRPSESSSLRDFLDQPAVAPIAGVDDPSNQLYASFFDNESPDVSPPVDKLPRKRFSKLVNKFSRKKKDRGEKPQRPPTIPGADAERPVYPQPATTPKEHAKDKGKGKESNSDPASADEIDQGPTPTPAPQPTTSASHTKRKAHKRIKRIRQAIMRRRNESNTPEYDGLDVTHVAYGHMDDVSCGYF